MHKYGVSGEYKPYKVNL